MIIFGLMSGTSLDGIDLALCDISDNAYRVLAATTVPYSEPWRQRLSSLEHSSALEYAKAHVELGHLYGQIINDFLTNIEVHVDAVASHGHTIFHQPLRSTPTEDTSQAYGLTTQIGCGDAIAAETGLLVVSNFRTLDVALGGQGAPLVPIGDELLFGRYDACLNLGGIANISYRADNRRIAFDICPCNMALNRLAARLGQPYDPDGSMARRGIFNETLNETLNDIDYYNITPPKSLGKEWFLSDFWPRIASSALAPADLLATVTHHIAHQISHVLSNQPIGSLLVTGGGAHNRYLMELLKQLQPAVDITIPDALTINYKEAIIFAFLGYLRLGGRVNTLASVTGARGDSIGGNVSGMLPSSGVRP